MVLYSKKFSRWHKYMTATSQQKYIWQSKTMHLWFKKYCFKQLSSKILASKHVHMSFYNLQSSGTTIRILNFPPNSAIIYDNTSQHGPWSSLNNFLFQSTNGISGSYIQLHGTKWTCKWYFLPISHQMGPRCTPTTGTVKTEHKAN